MTDENSEPVSTEPPDTVSGEKLQKKIEEAEKEANESEPAPPAPIEAEGIEAEGTETKSSGGETNEAKIDELTNALARAMADLQNYKRRTEEDQAKFVKFANAELLKVLLPIIDNFDRSTEHLPDDLKDNEWAKGIVQIHDDFLKTLETTGVKKIKTIGETLDPNLHEGLIAAPGKKDVILEELEPGYTLNDEVIKVAKVKVGDGTK